MHISIQSNAHMLVYIHTDDTSLSLHYTFRLDYIRSCIHTHIMDMYMYVYAYAYVYVYGHECIIF